MGSRVLDSLFLVNAQRLRSRVSREVDQVLVGGVSEKSGQSSKGGLAALGVQGSIEGSAGQLNVRKRKKSIVEQATPKADEAFEDVLLVERARDGDVDAFRILFERYHRRAQAVAFGVLGNQQDAEDVLQEAFLKAYRNLASFRGQSSFYTWLYRIVFNLSIDLSRKSYRKSEVHTEDSNGFDAVAQASSRDSSEFLAKHISPEEFVYTGELRERFSAAMGELSPEHRAVILLREVDGLSYAEISDSVGCSKGTVMSRLHHARKRLQKALQQKFGKDAEDNLPPVREDAFLETGD